MPLIKSNVHTHTVFCDGADTPERMVLAAISAGMDTLGFSHHSYTPFDTSYCIRDYGAYRAEAERLKGAYAQKIALLVGVELDLFGQRPPECDFVIGSVHYLKEGEKYYPVDLSPAAFASAVGEAFCGDFYAAAERYFEQVAQLAVQVSPDVYGHFDLITRFNAGGAFFDEGAARYKRAALFAAQALPAGAVVEVNLGRLFKGEGDIYPSVRLLRELNELGCRFMLSSDAHTAAAIGFAFDETCARLKKYGIRQLVRYKGGVLTDVEL